MTTTYGSIKIGQMFFTPGDSEFTFTKMRDYAQVNETGIYTTFTADQPVEPFGPEPRLNDHVTEIERLAITLISKHGSTLHPALGEWMRRLCINPDEFRHMDNYALAETISLSDDTTPNLAEFCRSQGFVIAKEEWDTDNWGASAIMDYRPRGPWTKLDDDEQKLADYDRAVFQLAYALRRYRENGRPDGDQTHTIMGMGAPLLTVSTSLAAACFEYHVTIVNLAYRDR